MVACAVEDLLTARGTGGGDISGALMWSILKRLSDSWEKQHLTNGKGGLIVFLLVAKRARHTAARRRNDMQAAALEEMQHIDSWLNADQGFLVTMAMKPYLKCIRAKVFRRNIATSHLTHNEFVIKKAIAAKPFRIIAHGGRHQVGVFTTEREYATGLNTHKRSLLGDYLPQKGDITLGKTGSRIETALRDGSTSALHMLGNLYLVAKSGKQTSEGKTKCSLLQISKLVCKKIYFPFCSMGIVNMRNKTAHCTRR